MIDIKIIESDNRKDINIPNEPFSLFGRMIPSYVNGTWDYTIEKYTEANEMTFPDEHYNFDEMKNNSTFIGAYDGNACIGLAILQEGLFKYMYLYDLKVNAAYRGQGIATMLIDRAMQLARDKAYIGIYTQGQDNNLAACLFYLKSGFLIGGFDSKVYDGTEQEGKSDIIFYKQ